MRMMTPLRRIHPRIPVQAPVEYATFERFHPDRILNLSATGAFVLSPKPLPIDQKLVIRFTLPEVKHPVEIEAIVVWRSLRSEEDHRHQPVGMGLRFEKVDADLFHILDQYVVVTLGLKTLDQRIGKELPSHVTAALPDPGLSSVEISLND